MTSLSFIYVTTTSKEEAQRIGRALLEKKLVACINVWEGMESTYWWEGKLESAKETILLLKTATEKVDAVIPVIKAMHSYSAPCVLSWPIEKGNPDYLKWLSDSLAK